MSDAVFAVSMVAVFAAVSIGRSAVGIAADPPRPRESADPLSESDRARLAEGSPALVKRFIATLRRRFTDENRGELREFIDPRYLEKHKLAEGRFAIETVKTGDIFNNSPTDDPGTVLVVAETAASAKEAFVFRTSVYEGKVYLLPLSPPDGTTKTFRPWILRVKVETAGGGVGARGIESVGGWSAGDSRKGAKTQRGWASGSAGG
jgi:hypothetical protein